MPALIPLGFWAASGAGGGGAASAAYELISTTVLGSAAASVTFSGLGTSAAAYKHLQIRAVAMTTAAPGEMRVYKNSTTSGYWSHFLEANGSTVSSNYSSAQSGFYFWYDGGQLTSTRPLPFVMDILDFQNTSKNQTVRALLGTAASGGNTLRMISSSIADATAIGSLTFTVASGNYATGSRFSLYGLR